MRLGTHHSLETRQKISEVLREKYRNGWKPRLGKRHSQEARLKISLSLKGKMCGRNNPFYGRHHTPETKEKISKAKKGRYLVHPSFEATPSLAYVLGVLRGDGSIYLHKKGADIRLTTASRDFAESFYRALREINLHPYMYKDRGKYYSVEASSKAFYNWYKELDLPAIEKLLDTEDKKIAFLRGFYESEGWCGRDQVQIYNTDRNLIDLVKRILADLGFDFRISCRYRQGKPLYTLYKHSRKVVKQFLALVRPCIKNGVKIGGTSPSFTFSVSGEFKS